MNVSFLRSSRKDSVALGENALPGLAVPPVRKPSSRLSNALPELVDLQTPSTFAIPLVAAEFEERDCDLYLYFIGGCTSSGFGEGTKFMLLLLLELRGGTADTREICFANSS